MPPSLAPPSFQLAAEAELPVVAHLEGVTRAAVEPPLSAEPTDEGRRRITATTLSIAVHILLIALLIWFAVMPHPVPMQAIPVRLVQQIPQPRPQPQNPKSQPKPQQKPQQQAQSKPPPPPPPKPKNEPQNEHGPLASDDMGNPEAPKDSKILSDATPAGPPDPTMGSEQAKAQGDVALTGPDQEPPKPAELGNKADRPKPVEQPLPKKGGARVAARLEKPSHAAGKYGKVFGPAATKDEYLAYFKMLVVAENGRFMGPEFLRGRKGAAVLTILVLPSGHINWATVERSSGWPDIDQQIEAEVMAVGSLPPVPARILGPGEPTLAIELYAPFGFGR